MDIDMPQGRIVLKRKTIPNKIRIAVILNSNLRCAICKKEGKSDRKFGKPIVVESEPRKRWVNEYDHTFLYEHLPMEFDHIIPLDKGGKTIEENLQILCRECNRKKGNTIEHTQTRNTLKHSETKQSVSRQEKLTHLEFVKLTKEEHAKLLQLFGEQITRDYIRRLNGHIGSKGDKYKSHYHTIRNWLNRDDIKPKAEKVVDNTAALECKRQEIREESGPWVMEIPAAQLLEQWKARPTLRWLIEELRPEVKEKYGS